MLKHFNVIRIVWKYFPFLIIIYLSSCKINVLFSVIQIMKAKKLFPSFLIWIEHIKLTVFVTRLYNIIRWTHYYFIKHKLINFLELLKCYWLLVSWKMNWLCLMLNYLWSCHVQKFMNLSFDFTTQWKHQDNSLKCS